MGIFRLLPWEYGIRNLLRRPTRTALTFVALTIVVLLVFFVVGFIRGLERSLEVSGDPQVALVFGLGMGENLEYSSIEAQTADLVSANLDGVRRRYGRKYASPELYLGTQLENDGASPSMGLVRGVTPAVLLVRRQVEIVEGRWPEPGELLVGRMAPTKLGLSEDRLAPGETIEMEGKTWKVSGRFAAAGSVFESELWCRLDDLQQALKRQDLSLVALSMAPGARFSEVNLFCKERVDLNLQTMRETEYYATLVEDYRPVRTLAWLVVMMVSAAGVFAGLNTMYGAIVGRVRELAALQTIGFRRRAIVASLIQEGTVLAIAASLLASTLSFALVSGVAVQFTMGAFELQVDSVSVLFGCGTGLVLGILGSLPPAIQALRMPVVDGLKAI